MNTKKPVKSFADALLSADSQSEVAKPNKVKPKLKAKSAGNTGSFIAGKKYDLGKISKTAGFHSKFTKDQSLDCLKDKKYNFYKFKKFGENKSDDSQSSRRLSSGGGTSSSHHKSTNLSNMTQCNIRSNSWQGQFSFSHENSSDSDDNEAASTQPKGSAAEKSSFISDTSTFTSNREAGSATTDKLVAKLLAEEEQRQQNTKMLQSVDEELMFFDLQLEDTLEMEMVNREEEKVPILAPGLPFVHSLTCHLLFSPDKVVWPFSPSGPGGKPSGSGGGKVTAITTWLGALDKAALRQAIQNRVLMEPELGLSVVGHLCRYLIRYIAAFPHQSHLVTATTSNTNNSKDSCDEDEGSEPVSENELVLSVYQLLCYHIRITSNPGSLLLLFISELPLALVNIGCDSKCFPAATLERWNINTNLYHNKRPNSAANSIAQMQSMQLLLNVLSNCLARVASLCPQQQTAPTGEQQPTLTDSDLDDLVMWLLLLGQDPKVLSCSLHISVSTAVGHALQLYYNFPSKVQDLVERISAPWLSFGFNDGEEDSAAGEDSNKQENGNSQGSTSNGTNSFGLNLDSFPHHTASYVCCTLLNESARSRMLAASLSFLALSACLECEDYEVLDYVEMSDVIGVLSDRKLFLLQECDCYKLRSVLLLLDTCITQVILRQPTHQKMQELRNVSDFVRVELVRLLGGDGGSSAGPGNSAGISSTRTKTQLTGLRTAMLQRWEKLVHVGASVYTPDGRRAMPGLGTEQMDVDA